jgi:phenylpyruvate tautomerase PptA (4-oxalocrotonate tautomerase family)
MTIRIDEHLYHLLSCSKRFHPLQTRDQMPTYACSAAAGRLTPAQKLEIVQSITAIHHGETGAPRYLVQVIFYDIAPANHYIAGQLAPAGQIWICGDIRDGRTQEQSCQRVSCTARELWKRASY